MKIGIDNALGLAPKALSLRAARTSVLANNIANADTPGFHARDVDFHSVLRGQIKTSAATAGHRLQTTATSHIATTERNSGFTDISHDQLKYRVPLMPSLDGNSVDTQVEQAAFAQNSLEYLTSLRILNGRIKGMLTAIKGE